MLASIIRIRNIGCVKHAACSQAMVNYGCRSARRLVRNAIGGVYYHTSWMYCVGLRLKYTWAPRFSSDGTCICIKLTRQCSVGCSTGYSFFRFFKGLLFRSLGNKVTLECNGMLVFILTNSLLHHHCSRLSDGSLELLDSVSVVMAVSLVIFYNRNLCINRLAIAISLRQSHLIYGGIIGPGNWIWNESSGAHPD